jgi:hypothetical protein
MIKFNLNEMLGGWFVGSFSPSVIKTDKCEVAIKKYKIGNYEKKHFHKEAIELTVIISGSVEMNGVIYNENDIILIDKNEATDFKCLTDVITCVYKSISVPGDKYILEDL